MGSPPRPMNIGAPAPTAAEAMSAQSYVTDVVNRLPAITYKSKPLVNVTATSAS